MSIIEFLIYYLPYKGYRYYDKDLTRAKGVILGIVLCYFMPILIYLTHYTDCFYFIEKPGEYHRRHPTTYLLGIPLILAVFLFFEIKKIKILKKYEEYEKKHDELNKGKKSWVIVFIIFTILYLITSFTLMGVHIIPSIRNCW